MNPFETAWKQMQEEYHSLAVALARNGCVQREPQFVHPVWQKFKEPIHQLLLGPPDQRFLDHPTLGETMVRRGFTVCQEHELAYLQNCIGEKSRQLLAGFRDADVPLPRECAAFNCSTNTLGHLYYAIRVLESCGTTAPQVIYEFGGGYGNLARIFKQFVPAAILVIIDLPELIALQHLFLRTTLDGVNVVVHREPPRRFEPGSIHLVPAVYVAELSGPADLFISTFALSETPASVQRLVAGKRFFQADMTYLAGQLDGGLPRDHLVHHQILHQAVRDTYRETVCQPFHVFQNGVKLYEIIGRAPFQAQGRATLTETANVSESSSHPERTAETLHGPKPSAEGSVILVKLQGGLGNQMFQYAAGLALAQGTKATLKLDLSFLRDRTPRPNFTYRDYCLDIFNLAPGCEIVEDGTELAKQLSCHTERQFHFDPQFERWGADAYLDGYWQSPRYFESVRDEVQRTFTSFQTPLTSAQQAMAHTIVNGNGVCLNVRRGDFANNPHTRNFHGLCLEGYYHAAVDRILRACPDAHFFIFSDDIEWCCTANLAKGAPSTFVTHDHAGDRFAAYLQLMLQCRHFILPNSSFGWWAAFLSSATDKMVIVPEPWFDDPGNNTVDLLPASWIRIPKYTQPTPASRTNDPLVSVAVLCHNHSRHLTEAVASILNQSFRDFEIVLIDDGSTDDSPAVAQSLAAEDQSGIPFRVCRLDDVGPTAARRSGVAQARGRYVLSLNGDDKLAPDYLAKTVPLLEADPKVGFVYTGTRCFGDSNETVNQPEYDFAELCRGNQDPHCALFRKAAYEEAGGYDPENWGYRENWQLWIRLSAKGWQGRLVNEPLFFHRRHSNSSLSSSTERLDRVSRAFIVTRQTEVYSPGEIREARQALRGMPSGWHRRPPLRDIHQLQTLLTEHPDNQDVMFFLAQVLANMNRKSEAVRLLCRLLSLQPDDVDAHRLLASLSTAADPNSRGTNRADDSEEVLGNQFGIGLFSFFNHLPEATLLEGNRDQLESRHVAINGPSEPSIYLHPPAQLRFGIPTARPGRLACAVAVQPEVWDKPHAGGCEFTLLVDRREVLRKTINPTLIPGDRRWHEVILDVPARSSGSHEFIFCTRAIGTPAYSRWALWRRPVFHWQLSEAHSDDWPGGNGDRNGFKSPVRREEMMEFETASSPGSTP